MIAPDKETNPLAESERRGPDRGTSTESTESTPSVDPAYEKLLDDIKGEPEPEPTPAPEPDAAEAAPSVETPEEAAERERTERADKARLEVARLRDPNATTTTEHAAIDEYAKTKIDPKVAEVDEAYKLRDEADARADRMKQPHTKANVQKKADALHAEALAKHREEDDLMIEEAAKLRAAAESSRELHEAKSEKDVDVAWEMAHVEDVGRERQAEILADGHDFETPRQAARRSEIADGVLAKAQAQSEVVGEETRKTNAQVDKAASDLGIAIEDLRANPNVHSLEGIGTNRNMKPEVFQQVLAEYFSNADIGVNLTEPFDQVVNGPRFGKERHDDFYYRSNKPEFKDIVFVVRYDHKSGTLERMDTVKVPQKLKPGKSELGWRDDKKWRGEVEDALVKAREDDMALPTDGSKPFTPELPSPAELKANKKAKGKQGGAVLVDFGATEQAAAKHKPKRKGWWLSLFG